MQTREQLICQELFRIDGATPAQKLGKHQKMTASPFAFFRGSAQLFYADIANRLLLLPEALQKIPRTFILGDAHVCNFGFMTEEGSFGDRVIFAPNDFDDACVGEAAWDIVRFCTSLILCADYCKGISNGTYAGDIEHKDKAFADDANVAEAIETFLVIYRKTCTMAIHERGLYQQAIEQIRESHILGKTYRNACARAYGGEDFFKKSSLAKEVDLEIKPLRFAEQPYRLRKLSNQEYLECADVFAPYVDDTILDIVERLNSGTGSNNLLKYYVLVGPESSAEVDFLAECHLVEIKQQRLAAPLWYFPNLSPINRLNPAHLSVQAQRQMLRAPDLVLDELEWKGHHWLVRSRHHTRIGIDPEDICLSKKANKGGLNEYADICAQTLALAHCRGDRRSSKFEQAIHDILADAASELIDVSAYYAQRVIQDWKLFREMML